MRLRVVYLLFFLFSATFVWSQQVIKGHIIDFQTQMPIAGVAIALVADNTIGTVTNEEGFFSFKVPDLPQEIAVSHISYEGKIVQIARVPLEDLIIALIPTFESLPEISVSSKRKIDTVFHEPYSVVDYEFSADHIWLLVNKNSREKYSLIVLDEFEEQVAELSLKDKKPSELHKDCEGSIFLLTSAFAHQLGIEDEGITLEKRFGVLDYEDRVMPCILATQQFRYFKRYFYQGQAMEYYAVNKVGEEPEIKFPIIQDEPNIDRLIEDAGCRIPWSGDIWQAQVNYKLSELRSSKYNLQGWMKIIYPKLYNPIIKRDSILSVFNHFDSKLQHFDEKGKLIAEVPIDYHKNKKWKKKIFYDERKSLTYTAFHTRWGDSIHALNLTEGTIGPAIPLNRALIENVKAWNGHLYFIYYNAGGGQRIRKLHKIYVE